MKLGATHKIQVGMREQTLKCDTFILAVRRSVRTSIALEFCNVSKVDDSIDRFFMNLSITT